MINQRYTPTAPVGAASPEWLSAYTAWDYVRAVTRRWWVVALFVLAGLGIACGITWWWPDRYISHAQMLFLPPQVSEKFVETNVSMQADQRVAALSQMVGSHTVASRLIQQLDLYPRQRRWWPIADLVPAFRKDLQIKVTGMGHTQAGRPVPTIQVSFRYPDAAVAQKVVERVVEIVFEENQRYRGNQTFRTTDFLQRQTEEIRAELKRTEDKLASLKIPDAATRFQATALATEKLHEIHRRVYAHQLNHRSVQQEHDLKLSQLAAVLTQLNGIDRTASRPAAVWAGEAWRVRLAEARTATEDARSRYKEGHPERETAERNLARVLREVQSVEELERKQLEDQKRQGLQERHDRLRTEVDALAATLKASQKEGDALAAQERQAMTNAQPNQLGEYRHLALQREHEILKQRYTELLHKQRDSEVATEMERAGQGEKVDLIEPAILPSSAELPLRWMKLSAGALAGLFAGLGMAVFLMVRHPRVHTSRNLEELLAAPLLAELPMRAVRLGPAPKVRIVLPNKPLLAKLLMMLSALIAAGCARQTPQSLTAQGIEAAARKPNEAMLLFRKAVKLDPRFGPAYREAAMLALRQGDTVSARQSLLRALELLPEDEDLRGRLAALTLEVYFSDPTKPSVLLREVEDSATQLVQRYPKRPDGYRLSAQVLQERGEFGEALKVLEKAARVVPDDASLLTQRASIEAQQGHRKQAIARLERLAADGARFAPTYDLLYLLLLEERQTAPAGRALERKWAVMQTIEAALQLAAHHEAAGERAASLKLLDDTMTLHAGDPRCLLRIADFWTYRGETRYAAAWLERGRRTHPDQTDYVGRQVELLLAQGDRAGAQSLLDSARQQHNGDPVLEAYAAALDMESGAAPGTVRARLESALSKLPSSPFVHFHLGLAMLRSGESGRAAALLQRAVTLDPDYAQAWLALCELLLQQGQPSKAASIAAHLRRRGASGQRVQLLEARAELGRNRVAEAERILAGLLASSPSNTEANLLMAETRLLQGRRGEALRNLEQVAARAGAEPGVALAVARIESGLGRGAEALRTLREASHRFPNEETVLAQFARLALQQGETNTALEQYRHLAAKHPGTLEYRLGAANCLGLLRRTEEAAAEYRSIQQASTKDPRPWLNYGAMMAEAGAWEQAMLGYREALARDSANPIALNNLADALARRGGDLSEALRYAEQAGRIVPDAAPVIDTLAYVYLRKGMAQSALASYQKLLSKARSDEQPALRERIRLLAQGNTRAVLAELDARQPAKGI